jgi:hypothetical protein
MRVELLFFEVQEEAENAAEAPAATGSEMIVVGLGGVFTLVDRRHALSTATRQPARWKEWAASKAARTM